MWVLGVASWILFLYGLFSTLKNCWTEPDEQTEEVETDQTEDHSVTGNTCQRKEMEKNEERQPSLPEPYGIPLCRVRTAAQKTSDHSRVHSTQAFDTSLN